VLFAEGWRRARDGGDLAEIAALAEALAGSRERHLETMLQGTAFLQAATAWPSQALQRLPADCPYCVAVGAVAGSGGVDLAESLSAFLQAFFSNLVQAAIRLGVVGQSDAVSLLAGFESLALATASRAAASSLDDLGGATFVSDIAAMNHETQYSRLFRS
jgi:urease accessory protein